VVSKRIFFEILVDIKMDRTKLVIAVDLSKEFGESKTGKSITIASTDGERLGAGKGGEQDRGECIPEEVNAPSFSSSAATISLPFTVSLYFWAGSSRRILPVLPAAGNHTGRCGR